MPTAHGGGRRIPNRIIFTYGCNLFTDKRVREAAGIQIAGHGAEEYDCDPAKRLPEARLIKNVLHTVALNKHLSPDVIFYDNAACAAVVRRVGGERLRKHFDNEKRGMFKADICRGAALYEDGGYYFDVDIQLRMPLDKFVRPRTGLTVTKMGADSTCSGCAFQAFIGAAPRHVVIKDYLQRMEFYYEAGVEALQNKELPGPVAFGEVLAAYTTGLVLLQQRPRGSGGLQGGGALLHKGCFSILHRQFVTLGVYVHLTEVAGIDLEDMEQFVPLRLVHRGPHRHAARVADCAQRARENKGAACFAVQTPDPAQSSSTLHSVCWIGGPKACALLTSPGPGHPAACGAGAGGKHTVDVYSVEARTFACADLEVNMTTNGIKPWMPHHSCAQLSALKYCTLTTASKIAAMRERCPRTCGIESCTRKVGGGAGACDAFTVSGLRIARLNSVYTRNTTASLNGKPMYTDASRAFYVFWCPRFNDWRFGQAADFAKNQLGQDCNAFVHGNGTSHSDGPWEQFFDHAWDGYRLSSYVNIKCHDPAETADALPVALQTELEDELESVQVLHEMLLGTANGKRWGGDLLYRTAVVDDHSMNCNFVVQDTTQGLVPFFSRIVGVSQCMPNTTKAVAGCQTWVQSGARCDKDIGWHPGVTTAIFTENMDGVAAADKDKADKEGRRDIMVLDHHRKFKVLGHRRYLGSVADPAELLLKIQTIAKTVGNDEPKSFSEMISESNKQWKQRAVDETGKGQLAAGNWQPAPGSIQVLPPPPRVVAQAVILLWYSRGAWRSLDTNGGSSQRKAGGGRHCLGCSDMIPPGASGYCLCDEGMRVHINCLAKPLNEQGHFTCGAVCAAARVLPKDNDDDVAANAAAAGGAEWAAGFAVEQALSATQPAAVAQRSASPPVKEEATASGLGLRTAMYLSLLANAWLLRRPIVRLCCEVNRHFERCAKKSPLLREREREPRQDDSAC